MEEENGVINNSHDECDSCGAAVREVLLKDSSSVSVYSTRTNNMCLCNNGHCVVLEVFDTYTQKYEPRAEIRGDVVTVHNDKHLTEEVTRLQNLVNDFEAANIRRQGEIESLRKELEAVHKSYQEKLNAKKFQVMTMSTELQDLRQSKRKDKIVDYSLVDPDLLRDYAVAKLQSDTECPDQEFDVDSEECEHLRSEIEKQATFHPHVQQQIVKDEQGLKRFRKNVLIDQLVEQAGSPSHTGQTGLNYVATLPASREDRAQLAQLIGYSVDGYQGLNYALPVEGEDE